MKIRHIFVVFFIFFASVSFAIAADESIEQKVTDVEVKVTGNNFEEYNNGAGNPNPPNGVVGGIPTGVHVSGGEVLGYTNYVPWKLNYMTFGELKRYAGKAKPKKLHELKIVNFDQKEKDLYDTDPEKYDRERQIVFLEQPAEPKSLIFLGSTLIITDPDVIPDPDITSAALEIKYGKRGQPGTHARIFFARTLTANEATAWGFALGNGVATNIGEKAGASVGSIIGKAKGRNKIITIVEVSAWGGKKKRPSDLPDWMIEKSENDTPPKKSTSTPAPPVEDDGYDSAPRPNRLESKNTSNDSILAEPIYFDTDSPFPKGGQTAKIKKMARIIQAEYMSAEMIEIQGYCDKHADIDYNAKLGFQRAQNVMYMILSELGDNKQIAAKIIALSGSNLNPEYIEDKDNRMVIAVKATSLTTKVGKIRRQK